MSAVSFIVSHNHPGGSLNASLSDWEVTKKLFNGGKAIEINLLDHLIIADDKMISLREMNEWYNLKEERNV